MTIEIVQVNGENIPKSMDIINRNSTYKNPGWFLRKAEHNYFELTHELAEKFEDMRIILDNIYGENWQFFFFSKYCLPRLYIRYPEVKITNSKGLEHTIRDLVISVLLEKRENKIFLIGTIRATRLTVTKEEFVTGYMHSHVPSKNYRDYINDVFTPIIINVGHSFCLGENEVPEVAAIFNDNQDIGTFELFLMTLNTMVEWESLEGVPHVRMGNISIRTSNINSHFYPRDTHTESLFNILKTKEFLIESDFDMDRNKINIIENDSFRERLMKKVNCYHKELLCKRVGDNYFKTDISDIPENRDVKAHFLFKNELIPFKIYNNRKEEFSEEDETSFQIHPIVYSETIKLLNNYLYEKSVEYYSRTATR